MVTTHLEPARDQRGSTLLLSLVFTFVAAILGLALFELGVVESRLVLTNQDDARAFEIAHAGVERALYKLQTTYNSDLTWATGSSLCSGGSHRGCSDGQFYSVATSYISDGSATFNSGSYAIQFRQVTAQCVTPASCLPLPIACKTDTGIVSDVDTNKKICDDLIFVRVTGSLANSSPGYSPTRTIQFLAKATLVPGTCLICGGLTGAAATGQPIYGNVKIAGSIQIAGVNGTTSLRMGASSGQTNSYAALDAESLHRIAQLPLVCPFGTICTLASQLVESLGATLKVARPTDVPAVILDAGAQLGQNGNQPYCTTPGCTAADSARRGKGPLDGIFVADGCNMPCNPPAPGASFDGNTGGAIVNSNVFVDDNNITKPAQGAVANFPLLTGPWQVFGVPYDHFACVQGSSCAGAPSTSEFFVSRAANIMTLPSSNCVPSGPGCAPIITVLSATGLSDGVDPFEMAVTFTDQSGAPVNGKICWDRARTSPPLPAGVSTPPAGLPRLTLEFGLPTCDTPAPTSNPLLLYMPSSTPATTGFKIIRNPGFSSYNYRGSAIIVTNGLVTIEETLQSCQTTTNPSPCFNSQGNSGPDLFTRDSSLTVMTTAPAGQTGGGNMDLGRSTANIERIMGLFYAGCDPTDSACGQTKGILTSKQQTNLVGTALGYVLCFAIVGGGNPACPNGGQVPSFFQVIPDSNNLVASIGTPGGGTFTVVSVQRYWVECKRTPGDTLPLTGFCSYQS